MIGIICGSEIEADYKDAASLLYDAAQTCTFIIAESMDFSVSDLSAAELGLIRYAGEKDVKTLNIDKARKELESAVERVDFMFRTDYDTVDSLPVLLRHLRNDNYNIARLNEQKAAEYGLTE